MSRFAVAIPVLILFAAPTIAAAKDKSEPRIQAMLACASVVADEARLRCYDQSVRELEQALGKGELVLNEMTGPKALESVVKASGSLGGNRYWIELESGDRWQLSPSTLYSEAPRAGDKVKLKRGISSNYWFTGPGWSTTPASFVRRP